MDCLHCGDCCLRMSPIRPCPHLIKDDDFYFCRIYRDRPDQCEAHDFPYRFCPIGMDILKLSYPADVEKIRMRLEIGYQKARELIEEDDVRK